MKISQRWLKENGACIEAREWLKSQKDHDYDVLFRELQKSGNLDWGSWFLARKLSRTDKIKYAVYAAKQVLAIYESAYPNDDRPRQAIRAAEYCIKHPNDKKAKAAAWAAWEAAWAARAAAEAARAAAEAARAAAEAARAAAEAAGAAKRKMQIKIIKYGLKLLQKEGL